MPSFWYNLVTLSMTCWSLSSSYGCSRANVSISHNVTANDQTSLLGVYLFCVRKQTSNDVKIVFLISINVNKLHYIIIITTNWCFFFLPIVCSPMTSSGSAAKASPQSQNSPLNIHFCSDSYWILLPCNWGQPNSFYEEEKNDRCISRSFIYGP